jgi:hypothetical protein
MPLLTVLAWPGEAAFPTLAVLLAGESAHDRAALARNTDALAAYCRARPGCTAQGVRDALARRVLLQVCGCRASALAAQASARALVGGAHAVEAVERWCPASGQLLVDAGCRHRRGRPVAGPALSVCLTCIDVSAAAIGQATARAAGFGPADRATFHFAR